MCALKHALVAASVARIRRCVFGAGRGAQSSLLVLDTRSTYLELCVEPLLITLGRGATLRIHGTPFDVLVSKLYPSPVPKTLAVRSFSCECYLGPTAL